MTARKRLNAQWCTHHWQPYQQRGTFNGMLASFLLVQRIIEHRLFTKFVQMQQGKGRSYTIAANMALEQVPTDMGQCWCCILGDAEMTKIQEESREPQPLQIPPTGAIH